MEKQLLKKQVKEAWHELGHEEAIKKLVSSRAGLSESEASQRLVLYGRNELKEEKKRNPLRIFLEQFNNFLVLILIAATVLAFFIGDTLEATAILIIVILNAIFGFLQEYRAEKTIQALKRLTAPMVTVLRREGERRMPSSLLVPGDVVKIEQGSKIPADLRLIETVELQVDESALTGESVSVSKQTAPVKTRTLAEMRSMAWTGTLVTFGRATGLVVNTGMDTQMGKIAHMVQEAKEEDTPLQKKLDRFGKNLGMLILVICLLVIVIGVLGGITPITMIMTGISLAIAAIPEGLPAVVTITLALGLQRLSKKNALMRRLPTVESLGSTTIICADKTGTLTKNEMTVSKVWLNGKTIEVTGRGFDPEGSFLLDNKEFDPTRNPDLSQLLKASALCNNSSLNKGHKKITGDPTEGALLVLAAKSGQDSPDYPRIKEFPFTSERKMMTTVNKTPNGMVAFSKGAPETILELSTHTLIRGKPVKLTPAKRREILDANQGLAGQALRVLAMACKPPSPNLNQKSVEKDLTFIGMAGMIDLPREEAAESIKLCKKAGIKVVMITGDHRETAVAIAKQLGLMEENHRALTGQDIERLGQKGLAEIAEEVRVYARVNPSHKVKIIDVLKSRGHIIAMTGDGVNDAPALKKADIGVAMGIKGTDVAKEASDMILTDDNFSSIVSAVREGRGIYDNIKKFIQYMLSSNLGEVLIVFLALLLFVDPVSSHPMIILTAIQLLWINLLTDGLPALALGVDPPAPDIMERPPRNPNEKILSRSMLSDIIVVGIIICIGTLFLFILNLPPGASAEEVLKAKTIAFTTIVVFEMVRVQSVRLKYRIGFLSNKKLILAMAASIALQIAVVYTPLLQPIFRTVPLDPMSWAEIILLSLAVLLIIRFKEVVFKSKI